MGWEPQRYQPLSGCQPRDVYVDDVIICYGFGLTVVGHTQDGGLLAEKVNGERVTVSEDEFHRYRLRLPLL